jgi:FdrA protein
MAVTQRVILGLYRDSVWLMQCSSRLQVLPGVEQASAIMATGANLDLARHAGLLGEDASVEAGPNDLLLLIDAVDSDAAQAAFDEVDRILSEKPTADAGEVKAMPPKSIRMALDADAALDLVLISTPGEYAASEALKALSLGLDTMIFSDNVELADEIELKRLAHERGLLVMGPDCGTAIVGGVPLGFANVVKAGDIGCVGASGTGLQEVTTLIDRWGAGVSHALGTGSHDLSVDVGGITMLDALSALVEDDATKVLLLVSKPPAPEVAGRVLEAAAAAGKPAVVCFLGADPASLRRPGVRAAATLEEAAALAVEASTGTAPTRADYSAVRDAAAAAGARLAPGQRYVRGLFSGGTFGYEASFLLSAKLGAINSNTPARPEDRIEDVWTSVGHTIIDLGDDVFTHGRPHPMIDYQLRTERIVREAQDPEVAVVLLDVVLGHGSNLDPSAELVPAIDEARAVADESGREIVFVASVCGTAGDPQGLAHQEEALRGSGVLLAESNAAAAGLAADIVQRQTGGV